MDGLRAYGIDVFARTLHHELTESDSKYAFFLGAGCSITSGIPAAAALVQRHWLPKLVKLRTGEEKHADAWAEKHIKDFKSDNPAASYSAVMEEHFNSPQKRQEEIERITRDGKPGYGYSALARLLAHEKYGRRCNVVLTTNFDDLVADALYLFGGEHGRPLVIGHEALMSFVRVTRTAPMVVKLHHDRHLAPKNTEAEIAELADHVCAALHNVLQERGLIFMGYGGADPSIVKALEKLKGGLPYGVYWINDCEPQADLRKWLIERKAIWVKHRDFDQAMFMIAKEFGLDQPQRPASFDAIFDSNEKKYKELLRAAGTNPDPEQAPLRQAAQQAASKVSDAFAMLMTAYQLEAIDPDAADKAYLDAIAQHPTNADLLGQYGRFLKSREANQIKSDKYYKMAICFEPSNHNVITNYAIYCEEVKKNNKLAEKYYRIATIVSPNNAKSLGNYALFLSNLKNRDDESDYYYNKAIDADHKYAKNLGNYAVFLHNVRNDKEKSDLFYRRALQCSPFDARITGNYAWFLQIIMKKFRRARDLYKLSIAIDPKQAYVYGNYAWHLHINYGETKEAEFNFKCAMKLNPVYLNIVCNYAGFLFSLRRDLDAIKLIERCESQDSKPALRLECHFYRLCRAATTDAERVELLRLSKQAVLDGVRSPNFDLSANVERARSDNVPGVDMLAVLAKVIADEEPAQALDQFPEWVAAG